MKLVELLAKELKEWPANREIITQSVFDSELYAGRSAAAANHMRPALTLSVRHTEDIQYPTVTRADWESERARIAKPAKSNKDGWVRHRGGKCPVEAGSVEIRMRGGVTGIEVARFLRWSHGMGSGDIMSYRIHKPSEETADEKVMRECVDKCASTESEHEPIYNAQAIEHGPLQWRDRINEIDFTVKALAGERASLVLKLADEGLQLIEGASAPVKPVEDMSDWRNWKVGDVLEMIGAKNWVDVTDGRFYKLVEPVKGGFSIIDDVGKSRDFDVGRKEYAAIDFKFHSRPSA